MSQLSEDDLKYIEGFEKSANQSFEFIMTKNKTFQRIVKNSKLAYIANGFFEVEWKKLDGGYNVTTEMKLDFA